MFRLSEKFEVLAARIHATREPVDGEARPDCYDVVIVGSGYGGAVAAARLAGLHEKAADGSSRDIRVLVLERGREWLPGDFPERLAELPACVRIDRWNDRQALGPSDGLFRVYANGDVSALVHSALGGGSQANAGVAERADPGVFQRDPWPFEIKREAGENPRLFARHYRRAERMLGLTLRLGSQAPLYRKQARFADLASAMRGQADRADIRSVRVAVHKPAPGNDCRPPDDKTVMATNSFGIERHPCIGCGNCVTGCNHHAKNTLATNYLPLAHRRGAEIFTGAHVAHVLSAATPPAPPGYHWQLEVHTTVADKRPERRRPEDQVVIYARVVVLAAGTYGSTEILLRSRERGLALSAALGSRFSTNGDGLHFRYFEQEPVHAIAGVDSDASRARPVGPTITHMFDGRRPGEGALDQQVVMQDGAIPSAIAEIFGEIVTTTGLLAQLAKFRTRVDQEGTNDAFAVSPDALARTQVLLAMGHDSAAGRLELDALTSELDDPAFTPARVSWPAREEVRALDAQGRLLELDARVGVSLVDPLGSPLPKSVSSVMTTKPQGIRLTVHPLGGCPMADGADVGVVNHKGQVYAGSPHTSTHSERDPQTPVTRVRPQRSQRESPPDPVHEGLYVLDGSIVPTSLGINPSLTITALAERAVELLQEHMGWTRANATRAATAVGPGESTMVKRAPPPVRKKVWPEIEIELRERLRLTVKGAVPPGWYDILKAKPQEGRKDVVVLDLDYAVPDLYEMLGERSSRSNPGKRHLKIARGRLRLMEDRSQLAPGSRLSEIAGLDVTEGAMDFFVPEPAWTLTQTARGLLAWWQVRGKVEILRGLQDLVSGGDAGKAALAGITDKRSVLPVACHAGERRFVTYDLAFVRDKRHYQLTGAKFVAFEESVNPWQAMSEFDARVVERGPGDAMGRVAAQGRFALDFVDLVRNRLPRVKDEPDAVSGLMAIGSLGMYLARMTLGIQLFRFQAPDYLPDDEIPPRQRTSGPLPGCAGPTFHKVRVHRTADDETDANVAEERPDDLELLLTRYQPEGACKGDPVMLFPGFAASSLQFSTDGVCSDGARNLPQVLCSAGLDVWLADVRTSSALPSCEFQWDFDTVARIDLPRMVSFVLDATGRDRVHLVGHCMGGALMTMAATDRAVRVQRPDGSAVPFAECVHSYVFSQVTPFVAASEANALRAELIATLRDALGIDSVHPTVDRPPNSLEALFDRFAWSCPTPSPSQYPFTVRRDPDLASIKRMSALLGVMWLRDNVTPKMRHALLDCYGPGNLSTFWQIMHFARSGRVVDREARNNYANDVGLAHAFAHAPVLVIHGEQSQMFDPRGSTRFAAHVNLLFDGPPRCFYLGLEDYGHFDPIMGRNAHRDVHAPIASFIGRAEAATAQAAQAVLGATGRRAVAGGADAAETQVVLPPRLGPFVGWVRSVPKEKAMHRLARVAFDVNCESTAKERNGLFLLRGPDTGPKSAPKVTLRAGWRVAPQHTAFDDMASIAVADIPLRDAAASRLLCLGEYVAPDGVVEAPAPPLVPWNEAAQVPTFLAPGKPGAMQGARAPASGDSDLPLGGGDVVLTGGHVDLHLESLEREEGAVAGEAGVGEPTARASFASISPTDLKELERYLNGEKGPRPLTPDEIESATADIPGERSGTMLEFALASCMSPGTPFDHSHSDQVLEKLVGDARRADGPEMALFVGDQVYLDDNADLFVTGTPKEYFFKRYRDAFGLPSLSALMRALPVYMAPDDHEIFDNFNGLAGLPKVSCEQVQSCIKAFDAFQGSHGPASILLPDAGRPQGSHWYSFETHGFPFFVMDTRFERERRTGRFIAPEQLERLRAFLKEHRTATKFVASGSILFPILKETAENPRECAVSDDSWLGYPDTALEVLDFIKREEIDNTIFLAGDAHCSLFTRIDIAAADRKTPLRAWSIVSSGVYTPYPFANNRPEDYVLHSTDLPKGSWVSTALAGVTWRNVASFDRSCYALVRVDSAPPIRVAVHFEGVDTYSDGADAADGAAGPTLRRVA